MNGGRSIRARLILALVGVSVFTLLVVGLIFYLFLGGYLLDRQKDQLLDQAVGAAEQVEGLRDALPAMLRGERVLSALLRSDLRVLPAGAGIVVFEGTDAVAKAGQTPAKAENLERLRAEGERLGADGPGAGWSSLW